jgi:hypothetical protein
MPMFFRGNALVRPTDLTESAYRGAQPDVASAHSQIGLLKSGLVSMANSTDGLTMPLNSYKSNLLRLHI